MAAHQSFCVNYGGGSQSEEVRDFPVVLGLRAYATVRTAAAVEHALAHPPKPKR
jgi:hypothetical protein